MECRVTDGKKVFAFEWKEVDRPLVIAPMQRSFDTRLIRVGLAGSAGTSEIEYTLARIRIPAPFSGIQERGELENRHYCEGTTAFQTCAV